VYWRWPVCLSATGAC